MWNGIPRKTPVAGLGRRGLRCPSGSEGDRPASLQKLTQIPFGKRKSPTLTTHPSGGASHHQKSRYQSIVRAEFAGSTAEKGITIGKKSAVLLHLPDLKPFPCKILTID
jgi:hypothetical protein